MAGITNLEDQIAACIWLAVALSSVVANGCAIFLLQRKKPKVVADILVLHLIVSELAIVMWNMIFRPIVWFADIHLVMVAMVRMIGSQFFSSLIYQSIIFISLDRFLVAILSFKYKVIVTKEKLWFVIVLIWVLSIISAVICGTLSSSQTIIWIFWSVITIISIAVSYSYIFTVLYKRKQVLEKCSSGSSLRRFDYKVPLCIAVSSLLTMLTPDIVTVIDPALFTMWVLVIWYTNFLIHPLLYVFFRVYHKRRSLRQVSVLAASPTIARIPSNM